jgi:hypothetical protein
MAASAINPLLWEDDLGATPPVQYEALDADGRCWWSDEQDNLQLITYIGAEALPATLEFSTEIVVAPISQGIQLYYELDGVPGSFNLGSSTGTFAQELDTNGATQFAWGISSTGGTETLYGATVAVLGPALPQPPPACDEMGRATRAYVSAYDRARVHQSRLYRFERRCMVANFNGAIPPARTITSATWRTDAPEIGLISNPQISPNGRETMVMFAAQLGGWANLRVDATLDNGEIYAQALRVNVREASGFFDDPPITTGPFSVTVTA